MDDEEPWVDEVFSHDYLETMFLKFADYYLTNTRIYTFSGRYRVPSFSGEVPLTLDGATIGKAWIDETGTAKAQIGSLPEKLIEKLPVQDFINPPSQMSFVPNYEALKDVLDKRYKFCCCPRLIDSILIHKDLVSKECPIHGGK